MKKVMKDEIKLTREELHEARAWAQDESWVKERNMRTIRNTWHVSRIFWTIQCSVHGSVYSAWTDYL